MAYHKNDHYCEASKQCHQRCGKGSINEKDECEDPITHQHKIIFTYSS